MTMEDPKDGQVYACAALEPDGPKPLTTRVISFCTSIVRRISAAALLLPIGLVLAVIFVFHKLTVRDGGPFLYSGPRMGKYRVPFTLYKVRTLKMGASEKLEGQLHRDGSGLEVPLGAFLRRTRLDEFPQIWNVLKGDMAFVGPRPVRQSIYEKECRHIRGYDSRFWVLPGLTGLSQFLTPHDTPKAVRARIDRILVHKIDNPFWVAYLALWTGWVLIRNLGRETAYAVQEGFHRFRPEWTKKRDATVGGAMKTVKGMEIHEASACFSKAGDRALTLLDVPQQNVFHVLSERSLEEGEQINMRLTVDFSNKKKQVRFRGVVQSVETVRDESNRPLSSCKVGYEPTSELQSYKMRRYVTRSAFAQTKQRMASKRTPPAPAPIQSRDIQRSAPQSHD